MMIVMKVDMRYQMMLAYTAHDGLVHLPALVPYPLDDADRNRREHARHQEKERGINVGESRTVKSR